MIINKIREYRHKNGLFLTQAELAEKVGCSRMGINRIEQGGTPSLITALKIAAIFEVSIHEIFKLDNYDNKIRC